MEVPAEVNNYIKESIEISLGLPISEKNMRLKLLALEDARHSLQNQVFLLEDRLHAAEQLTEKYKAESSMNAEGLRRCITKMEEERENYEHSLARLVEACDELERERNELLAKLQDNSSQYEKMEEERKRCEDSLARLMDTYDDLEREKNELLAKLLDNSSMVELVTENENLKEDKETLLQNLNRAKEEVKILHQQNKCLEKQLMCNQMNSASDSAEERGKSKGPLTPIHFNSPDFDNFSI